MVTLVTDYGTFDLPLYWDGTNGLDYRLPETVDGVAMVRFYAPAYALMLQAQARAASAGAMGFAMRFTWDDGTSAADPGAGKVRIDNATAGSATAAYANDADANGSDRSAIFALFDDGTSTVKGLVSLVKLTDPSKWLVGKLTATTDGAGFWTLTLTSVQASGTTPFTAGDSVVLGFVPAGDRGWPNNGFRWTFSTTTTDADPGAGIIRLDNATQNIATQAFIDLADADGATQTTWLDAMDDASGTKKGTLRIAAQSDPTRYLSGTLTAVTSAAGYRKLVYTVLSSSGAAPFADGEALFVSFAPAGDAGDMTGPASSTDTALVRWNGTGGSAADDSGWLLSDADAMTAGGTLDMAGNAITIDFATHEQAGQHAATISTSVSGEVILADTGAPYRAYTLPGDTTLLVAGATTPGYVSGGYRVVVTQDGTGGRDVTILPANLLLNTDDFSTTWTATSGNTVSVNDTVAPDGTTTADTITWTTTADTRRQDVSVANDSASYTAVIFFKETAGAFTALQMAFTGGTTKDSYARVNLETGDVVATGSGAGTATVTSVAAANGYWKVTISNANNGLGNTVLRVSVHKVASDSSQLTGALTVWRGNLFAGASELGTQKVGATRAGMVTWPNADEPDWAAQAADTVTEISLLPAYDGNIHAYKIRGG